MVQTKTPPVVVAGAGTRVKLSKAAEILGVNRLTMRRWLEKGKFPGAYREGRPGADWSIPFEDVQAVAQEREKARHPMDQQILDRLASQYVTAVADVTMAATLFLERHEELALAVKSPDEARRHDVMKRYQESLDLLVGVADTYRQMATVRMSVEMAARSAPDRPHPEDGGPIPQ